ncbi:MAG: hypothetical protein AAGF12_24415, partial [Myxococcota bacterium]
MFRKGIAWLLLVSLVPLVGCRGHVQLSAPDRTAPLQARVQAYEELRPTLLQQTQNYHVGAFGAVSRGLRTTDYIITNGGERVYHPEDLLPVVDPDSPTAIAAEESDAKKATAAWLAPLFVGSIAAGAAVALTPYIVAEDVTEVGFIPLIVGIAIILVGGLGTGIPMLLIRQSAEDDAATAFATYGRSLREHLNLCTTDGRIYDCDTGPIANVPPPGQCTPACRSGFMCVAGQCVSACNPPCGPGEMCT